MSQNGLPASRSTSPPDRLPARQQHVSLGSRTIGSYLLLALIAVAVLVFVRFRRWRLARKRADADGRSPAVVLGSVLTVVAIVAVVAVILHR